MMSENFQKHLLKWWYFKCFYEQNLTVTNSPKLRGLPIFITRRAYFSSYPTKCISCFMLRHLMTPRNLRSKILKFNYLKKKKAFEVKQKALFLVSKVLSFRLYKQNTIYIPNITFNRSSHRMCLCKNRCS